MKLLLLPAVWAGLRGDLVRQQAGSSIASGVGTSSIPCETAECHADNRAYKDRLRHQGWSEQNVTNPAAAPEALSTGENTTGHAVIYNKRLFAGSPCTDATARQDLAAATKYEIMQNNSALQDQVDALRQANAQAMARLHTLQAAEVRAATTNNQTSRWCQSRQAQIEAQAQWFDAHMEALKNRCDRAESMSSQEFKDQFKAVLDKFRTEAAAAVELQKKKVEEEARKAEEDRKAKEFAMFGPGALQTEYDSKCLDYNYNNGNVYMHDCHREGNQIFYIEQSGGLMKTHHDNKCLDYNYNNGNVYMHDCHGGGNQQWYIDHRDGSLRTRHDSKCLDYNYNNGNVYMHDCHHEPNQRWRFTA